jgi:hypothetical protein
MVAEPLLLRWNSRPCHTAGTLIQLWQEKAQAHHHGHLAVCQRDRDKRLAVDCLARRRKQCTTTRAEWRSFFGGAVPSIAAARIIHGCTFGAGYSKSRGQGAGANAAMHRLRQHR